MSDYVFIDTETAGLNIDRHPIWEVAVIDRAGDEHVWQQQMYGGVKDWRKFADPWVIENTRVGTEYDPAVAMTPMQSTQRFAQLVEGARIVGANPSFDMSRLERQYRAFHQSAMDLPWHHRLVCVENLVWGKLGRYVDGGLAACAEAVGVPVDRSVRHTALGDARLTKAVFEAVIKS